MKKKDLIYLFVVLIIIIALVIFGSFGSSNKKEKKEKNDEVNINLLSGKYYALITVKDYGKIKVELDADAAPITVTNFVNLVNDGFYDGLTFHRIMENFMIQGGGYNVDGSRKPASNIKGEFSLNGVTNNISHKRGVISMARADNKNSASSEFFIMNADYESLDGSYAAFGHVISGMDVVDKITKKAKPVDNNGSITLDERPVIESIVMLDE